MDAVDYFAAGNRHAGETVRADFIHRITYTYTRTIYTGRER